MKWKTVSASCDSFKMLKLWIVLLIASVNRLKKLILMVFWMTLMRMKENSLMKTKQRSSMIRLKKELTYYSVVKILVLLERIQEMLSPTLIKSITKRRKVPKQHS